VGAPTQNSLLFSFLVESCEVRIARVSWCECPAKCPACAARPELRDFAGHLQDFAGHLRDFAGRRVVTHSDVAGIRGTSAGLCRTLRESAGIAGPCGTLVNAIAHDRPLQDSKKWATLWRLGGNAHHYRFFHIEIPTHVTCESKSQV
jgi:hypothetical protein